MIVSNSLEKSVLKLTPGKFKANTRGSEKHGKNPPPGEGHRHGQVTDRSETYNPHNFKGVRKEK